MATALAFWVVGTACVETVDEVVCVTIDDTTGDTVKSSSGEIICDAPDEPCVTSGEGGMITAVGGNFRSFNMVVALTATPI